MARVLTVFNHGTASHSKADVVIAELGMAHEGTELAWGREDTQGRVEGDYLVNEGPGSTGGSYTPGHVNPFSGKSKPQETWFARLRGKDPRVGMSEFAREFQGWTSSNTVAGGLLFGSGWDDNVVRTLYFVSAMPEPPRVVNMVGWSRGAVTCLRIANALHEVFPDIEVNIFAYDPVAGGSAGETMADTQTIPENVRQYLGILSMHERRGGFSPQDLSRVKISGSAGRVLFLPMPGHHSAQVQKGKADLAWALSRSLAYGFLRHHGSRITLAGEAFLTCRDTAKAYAAMVVGMERIAKKVTNKGLGNWVMGGFSQRDFTKKLHEYTASSSYFVNEHHRACFRRTWPRFYDYVFGNTNSVAGQSAAVLELQAMPAEVKASLSPWWAQVGPTSYVIEMAGGYDPRAPRQGWSASFAYLLA